LWEARASGADTSNIFLKRDGADFDPSIINLSDNPANSRLPAMTVSDSNVYVVWKMIVREMVIFFLREVNINFSYRIDINIETYFIFGQ
jgi:hypothetical protein